jgi:hypothetical protein
MDAGPEALKKKGVRIVVIQFPASAGMTIEE